MKPSRIAFAVVVAAQLIACKLALAADEVDPAALYELSTAGTSSKVKSGEKGTFVLAIKTKSGSHVSDEAPLKFEITGKNVKPQKEKLSLSDAVGKKVAGGLTDPRFEIPFTGEAAGPGAVDAKLTFFICTEKICARQQKTLSLPVQVD